MGHPLPKSANVPYFTEDETRKLILHALERRETLLGTLAELRNCGLLYSMRECGSFVHESFCRVTFQTAVNRLETEGLIDIVYVQSRHRLFEYDIARGARFRPNWGER